VWSEDVLVRGLSPESLYTLTCCSSLVFIAELFANLVDGNESPALGLKELHWNLLGVECFYGPREGFVQGLHCVTVSCCSGSEIHKAME
jgi:hypothetical protein